MRKLLGLVSLFIFAGLLVSPSASANVDNFDIKSFTADYYLTRDSDKTSQMEVKETIVAEFPSFDQNHGILRAIPKKYQGHSVSLEIKSVTDQSGKAYPYSSNTENDNTVLKIGDANKYVYGITTYNINYTMRNVINFQDQDELYWDINGDQWPQTMETVTARLHLKQDIANSLTGAQECYAGPQGSTFKNCTVGLSRTGGDVIITSTATNVRGFETLTSVVGFKKGTFQQGPEVAVEKRNRITKIVAVIGISLILPLVTFIVCFRKWWKQGRDPEGRGVIIPEYVAPKKLNVVSSSFILEMSLPTKAITAGIIEMAVSGILRISEIQKKNFLSKTTEYELEITKDPVGLSTEQQFILDALFDGPTLPGSRVNLSQHKNKLHSTVTKVSNHLATSMTATGYFSSDPTKARNRFTAAAVAMLVLGFIMFFLLPIAIGLVVAALIAFIFGAAMPARTAKGVETRDYLLGLKHYIKMAEADRIKYLQSPQGAEKKHIDPNNPKQQIKLFEELLPYAILFGLEKEWAEHFKDLYKQPPNWYSGNVGTFNSVYLASSLGKFNSVNATAFTAPSSSGSSGLGGGGFSGGGGGGGGGGGW